MSVRSTSTLPAECTRAVVGGELLVGASRATKDRLDVLADPLGHPCRHTWSLAHSDAVPGHRV
jgi:hypothetical protein